jgi:hypothetical protein
MVEYKAHLNLKLKSTFIMCVCVIETPEEEEKRILSVDCVRFDSVG